MADGELEQIEGETLGIDSSWTDGLSVDVVCDLSDLTPVFASKLSFEFSAEFSRKVSSKLSSELSLELDVD